MTENSYQDSIKEYKDSLREIYYKSQEVFEQKLTLITTSSLGASIFLLEKLVPSIEKSAVKWSIVFAWLLLGASLLINLISHKISASNCYASIQEIENNNYDQQKSEKRHKQINKYNSATIWTLGLGIMFLVLFSTINLYKMSNQNTPPNPPTPPANNERGMAPTPAPKPLVGLNPSPAPQTAPPSAPPAKGSD